MSIDYGEEGHHQNEDDSLPINLSEPNIDIDFDALFAEIEELEAALLNEQDMNKMFFRFVLMVYAQVAEDIDSAIYINQVRKRINLLFGLDYENGADTASKEDILNLDNVINNYFEALLKKIIKRIKDETEIAKECEGVIDIDFYADIKSFVTKNSIQFKNLGTDLADYRVLSNRISINKENHSMLYPEKRLHALASTGLSGLFGALFHELIHRGQRNLFRLLSSLFKNDLLEILNTQILNEVHAHITQKHIDDYALSSYRTSTIVERIKNYSSCKTDHPDDIEKIISAIQAIQILKAFNLDNSEITRLVRNAKWDRKRLCYDSLEDRITLLKQETGLSSAEIDALVDAMKLRRSINLLKLKKIVQEEIKKAIDGIALSTGQLELMKKIISH